VGGLETILLNSATYWLHWL